MAAKPRDNPKQGTPKGDQAPSSRGREAVLADFRKIAGPLRGRNQDRKPKS